MVKRKGKAKDPKWLEFEQLVAQIYAQATPSAEVQHNFKIVGKSGRKRQIDIAIKAKQGLHSYLTVVECKKYARSVGITTVEAFATKLHDVRANKGVIVSARGFDEGARAQAEQHNITLFSYREAVKTDWEKVSAGSVWITFTTEAFIPDIMLAELIDGHVVQVGPLEHLYAQEGERLLTGLEIAENMIVNHPSLAQTVEAAQRRGPGRMWISGRVKTSVGPLYSQQGSDLIQIDKLTIQGDMHIRAYPINPAFETGHVMEDVITGQQSYTEVSSAPFSIQAVINSQEGREVTMDEYHAVSRRSFFIPPETTLDKTQFRITITSPSVSG